MQKLVKKRWVIVTFAILVAIGTVAAYIPLLFPPQEPQVSQNTSAEQPPVATSTTTDNQSVVEVTTTTYPTAPAATSSKKSPDAFSGIQDEQKSLDQLNNLLNQTPQ